MVGALEAPAELFGRHTHGSNDTGVVPSQPSGGGAGPGEDRAFVTTAHRGRSTIHRASHEGPLAGGTRLEWLDTITEPGLASIPPPRLVGWRAGNAGSLKAR